MALPCEATDLQLLLLSLLSRIYPIDGILFSPSITSSGQWLFCLWQRTRSDHRYMARDVLSNSIWPFILLNGADPRLNVSLTDPRVRHNIIYRPSSSNINWIWSVYIAVMVRDPLYSADYTEYEAIGSLHFKNGKCCQTVAIFCMGAIGIRNSSSACEWNMATANSKVEGLSGQLTSFLQHGLPNSIKPII
jgi:hypothetical protein